MARLIGGSGEPLRIHQWANDWISVDSAQLRGVIVPPTALELDAGEAERIQQHPEHTGRFWQCWELYEHRRGRWRLRQRKGTR